MCGPISLLRTSLDSVKNGEVCNSSTSIWKSIQQVQKLFDGQI